MKKLIIVGGGVAGLTAGIYACKCGLEVELYEMHTIPGGECTGWDRKGYHFDNCIHWLTGTKEETSLYKVWEAVGALEGVDTYTVEEFRCINYKETMIHLYNDVERLRSHLKEISPEDAEGIDGICDDIKCLQGLNSPIEKPSELMNLKERMKLMRDFKSIGMRAYKLMNITMKQYIEEVRQIKHEAIKTAFSNIVPQEYTAIAALISLATTSNGNGAWPMGGSRAMAMRMADKLQSYGGKIYYKEKVKEIIVTGKKAEGILLEKGKIISGDYIVSATDLNVTMQQFLGGMFKDKKIDKAYENRDDYKTFTSVDIGLGIAYDLSKRPKRYEFEIEPLQVGNIIVDRMAISHYCYEKSFAPERHSSVRVSFMTDYEWWKQLYTNKEAYKKEKEKMAEEVAKRVESVYPETKGKIEVKTVATPMTYERYCGAYEGAWMSFAMIPRKKSFSHKGRIKGIKNMYLAGQWLYAPGGLPSALATGRWAIQRLCHNEKILFVE